MNILLLTSVAGNGGSSATLFHNARILAANGFSPVLFAPGDYWKSRGDSENVKVVNTLELRRGFRPISFLRDFFKLRRFIIDNKSAAVVVQKSPEQWLAGFVLLTLKPRVALVRLRGVVFAIKPSILNRWLHNRMDAVICSAGVITAQFRALPGFSMARVHTLLEGIDPQRFAPAMPAQRAAARARWKLDPAAFVLGTAGRPSPVKGHDVLVRAFAQAFAHSENKNIRLAIFSDESRRGPGSYQTLADLCTELGIRDRVDLFPEFIADMRGVYHALDAYVLPSLGSEGSSRAGLEACACGLPVLASRVGVLPDLIVENKTGVLLPPCDVETLAHKLKELAAYPGGAKLLGEAARQRIVEQFDEKQYGQSLCKLIREAVLKKNAK